MLVIFSNHQPFANPSRGGETRKRLAGPTKFSRITYPGKGCKFLFASSGACFGERPEGPETDLTKLLPQTSYGMHLVNEVNEQVGFFLQVRIHAVWGLVCVGVRFF